MADSDATPPPDPSQPKRQTLRISLPPRPLRPDSSKSTPRPNVSAATTLPINLASLPTPAAPADAPAWSTAVTRPIPNARPPSGIIPLRSAAPPVTGAPVSSKTTPLHAPAIQPPTGTPETSRPSSKLIPNPGVRTSPLTPTGSMGVQAPRVIVANPQAKVFLKSGKMETPGDLAPVQHQTNSPALPSTQSLPNMAKTTPGLTIPPPLTQTSSVKEPAPLAPQPPLTAGATSAESTGITAAPGRPTTGDGLPAIRRPTTSLRMVDVPSSASSLAVTQAITKPPTPTASMPTVPPLAKTLPATGPIPKAPALPPPLSSDKTPAPSLVPVTSPAGLGTSSTMPMPMISTTRTAPSALPPAVVPPPPVMVAGASGSVAVPVAIGKTPSGAPTIVPPPIASTGSVPAVPSAVPVSPTKEAVPAPLPSAPKLTATTITAAATLAAAEALNVVENKAGKVSPDRVPQPKPPSIRLEGKAITPVAPSKAENIIAAPKTGVVPPPRLTTAMSTPDKPATASSSIAPPRRDLGAPPVAPVPVAPAAPKPIVPGAVMPVAPTGAVRPASPVAPVAPLKPMATGGVMPAPIRPVVPGATTLPVTPTPAVAPGKSPLKPVPATAAGGILNPNKGTTVVKTAPPKETARITVKPNLPGSTPVAAARPAVASVKPGVAPVVAAGAAAAVVAATAKPASPKPAVPTTTPVPATTSAAPVRFQEEPSGSTLMTTVAAGLLALLTWGTAGILLASVYGYL